MVLQQCNRAGVFALTFDDGPSENTPDFLRILNAEGVKATFFTLGVMVNQYGAYARQAYEQGHQIAAHSYDHTAFTNLNAQDILQQLQQTDRALQKAIGVRPTYFRFPYGDYDEESLRILRDQGYKIIGWNFDAVDYQIRDAKAIASAYGDFLAGANVNAAGVIALNHDIVPETAEALQQIIRAIKSKGYRLVTVAECLGDMESPYR